MINKNIVFLSLIVFLGVFCFFKTTNAATFDPNFIISDEEMTDASSLDINDIQAFLAGKGSYLARYTTTDAYGISKTAAEIIYNAANNYDCETNDMYSSLSESQKTALCEPATINPKLLLVLLQKEQSLIEDGSPSQKQLDWATGYGICDSCSMNDPALQRYRGFGKQVNSAALQFFDYLQNPNYYTYRAGNTYTVTNTGRPSSVIQPANQATAALYNYTPHVYNGNYNFYKLWMKYFTFSYPNGTLLQAKGEPGVWLIQDGKKRPFLTRGALTSRFDINKVVQVNKTELERYTTSEPIKFPQYSLVRSPRGTVFLLIDDMRRGFASAEALRVIGINPEEIINASWDDINVYEEGLPITATSSYPTGALLQDKTTGGVYWVSNGTKAPLWDAILLKTKFRGKLIIAETPEKLASFETVDPAIFNDGELLTTDNSRAVYVIDNKKRRPIVSGDIFEELGYKWENIISVPDKILNLYEEGELISSIYSDEELLELELGTSTPDMLGTGTPATASSTGQTATTTLNTDEALEEEIDAILNP